MKKRIMSLMLALTMVMTLIPKSVVAGSWPFVPSENNRTNGKIKSGWYIIYSHDLGTFRIDGSNVVPSRRAKEVFYFEHLGSNKYYIYDSNGNYLAFEGNYAGKKPIQSAKIVVSESACKWMVYANNAGGSIEYEIASEADHGFNISTGIESCTATKDSKLFLSKEWGGDFRAKFTLVNAPDELIPQWWQEYKNGGTTPTDGKVYVVSTPVETEYEVGEGFDTHGILVKARVNGKEIDVSDKITFYTSKTVQLTQNRPFTVAGTKVVELRYEGKKVGEYTVTVIEASNKPTPTPTSKLPIDSKKVGAATLSTYVVWGNINDEGNSEEENMFGPGPYVGNYGYISPMSQFVDQYGKFAFAYDLGEEDDNIYINKADGTSITIPKAAPLFGAVTQDSDGYYYAVTGKRNGAVNSSNADVSGKYDMSVKTVFISKYTSKGALVKTTGFVGNLTSISGARTQNPFIAGNCSVAINSGVLVCSYARQMYNGHQGKDIIAVNISNMSKAYDNLSSDPWVSHSFDQRVIWYSKSKSWLFVDQGDAYPRSFVADLLNIKNLKVTRNTILTFKGKKGDNKTNSQLGGVVETASGVMFVGAAGKNGAQDIKQQLFVTVFDPTKKDNMKTIWLTENAVVEPQLVSIGNGKFVVLWEEHGKVVTTYYMVLDDNGKKLVDKTSLGNIRLQDNEDPVFAESAIQWVAEEEGVLLHYELRFESGT